MDNAHEFTNHLRDLLRREHGVMADFLVALADFDGRRLWVNLGYASIFDFLVRELGLSKASASFRKKAAELIQRRGRANGLGERLRHGAFTISGLSGQTSACQLACDAPSGTRSGSAAAAA